MCACLVEEDQELSERILRRRLSMTWLILRSPSLKNRTVSVPSAARAKDKRPGKV